MGRHKTHGHLHTHTQYSRYYWCMKKGTVEDLVDNFNTAVITLHKKLPKQHSGFRSNVFSFLHRIFHFNTYFSCIHIFEHTHTHTVTHDERQVSIILKRSSPPPSSSSCPGSSSPGARHGGYGTRTHFFRPRLSHVP